MSKICSIHHQLIHCLLLPHGNNARFSEELVRIERSKKILKFSNVVFVNKCRLLFVGAGQFAPVSRHKSNQGGTSGSKSEKRVMARDLLNKTA